MSDPTSGPTLRDLATLAGVSRQTVSDALRGTGRVASETRKRIRDIARAQGYRPDPIVSAGMAQMRRRKPVRFKTVIGYLETDMHGHLTEAFESYTRLFRGAKARAKELGYGLERFSTAEMGSGTSRLQDILLARGIRGLVILYVQPWTDTRLEESPLSERIPLNLARFSTATVGARTYSPALHFAMADEVSNTRLCLEKLLAHGYRRIGMALPAPLDDLVENRFTSAYYGWQQRLPKRDRIPVHNNQVDDLDAAAKRYAAWLERWKPEAIVSFPQAGLNEALRLRFPRHYGFVHLDRNPSNKRMAGVDQNHEAVGAAAVDLVDRQLSLGQVGIPSNAHGLVIEGRWMSGSTIHHPPSSTRNANDAKSLARV